MDCANENIDFSKFINPKKYMENVTPHKIAVVAFIREFCMLKRTLRNEPGIGNADFNQVGMEPKHRKDFCILALKLIQCPDMEFKDFEALLTDGKYNLLSVHLQNFCSKLQYIYVNGVGALMDCVTSTVDKLITEHNTINPCVITRNSVLGFYLRRIMVNLVKLTFVQISSLYKSFCLYYQKGRPGLMIRSLSKEKLNSVEQLLGTTPVSPVPTEESKPLEYSIRMGIIDRDINVEECQWSRKQAALFTAQQANLIEINEPRAMPPKQLQKTIKQIINDIPDYPDVHFLSFLNSLRVKEFCGAQDSLYNYFDRTIFTPGMSTLCNDRNKSFRYAALNRAAMHFQFGHKEMAMESVHEAMVLAQEAGDAACLAHVAAWAARAGSPTARGALLPAAARRPRPAHAPYSASAPTASAAAVCTQQLAQHRAVNAAHPAHVFNLIVKGDAINYLHSMTDLAIASLANTAALWSLYGKTEMASICCQLLLNLNTKCGSAGGVWHWTSGTAAAVAGVAATAAWRGDLTLAAAITSHHPAPEVTRVAHRITATICLYAGRWEEAEQSINQLASIDRWESQLLKAEMYYYKGEPTLALQSVNDVLDNCTTEDDSEHFISLRLRAMILTAQVQHSFGGIQDMNSSNIMILNKALTLAHKYNLHYLAATIEMHIGNMQLHMGAITNALMTVKKVLPTIMAHGGAYDMARAVLLYTKCAVASAPTSGAARTRTLQSCCHALETVKKNFAKVEAHSRIMGTWYLQAQIYNEIGNQAARNACAWMYHQLESQYSIEPRNTLLLSY